MTPPARTTRAAAAAIALAALGMSAEPAAALVTERHFQQNLAIDCGGTCSRKFPQLPANQVADVDHIACELVTEGAVSFVRLTLLPTTLNFSYPLPVVWQ